jgi:hypothetical protein
MLEEFFLIDGKSSSSSINVMPRYMFFPWCFLFSFLLAALTWLPSTSLFNDFSRAAELAQSHWSPAWVGLPIISVVLNFGLFMSLSAVLYRELSALSVFIQRMYLINNSDHEQLPLLPRRIQSHNASTLKRATHGTYASVEAFLVVALFFLCQAVSSQSVLDSEVIFFVYFRLF